MTSMIPATLYSLGPSNGGPAYPPYPVPQYPTHSYGASSITSTSEYQVIYPYASQQPQHSTTPAYQNNGMHPHPSQPIRSHLQVQTPTTRPPYNPPAYYPEEMGQPFYSTQQNPTHAHNSAVVSVQRAGPLRVSSPLLSEQPPQWRDNGMEKESEVQAPQRSSAHRSPAEERDIALLEQRFAQDLRLMTRLQLEGLVKHCKRYNGNILNRLLDRQNEKYNSLIKELNKHKKNQRPMHQMYPQNEQ